MTADAHGNFSGKHLVIFGAGYVGSAVAREARARGLRVTALTRNPEKASALRELGVRTVIADLAENAWHGEIGEQADLVLNCVSSGGGGLAGYERSYLRGMESILDWARLHEAVGTMVYTSSTSVYPQDGGVRVDETAPTVGSGDRAKILVAAEDLLRGEKKEGGVREPGAIRGTRPPVKEACQRWFILRLAGIYGPERHHLLGQVRAGEVAGRGDFHLNLIHLEDICGAIWAAFAAPGEIKNEILNVADDGAARKAEIVAWIAARIGVPEPRFTGEPAAGRRVVTPDRIIANRKLKTLLGWRPRYPDFRAGYTALVSSVAQRSDDAGLR